MGSINPSYDADKAHQEIEAITSAICEKVEEAMLNEAHAGRSITREKVVAQIIMEELFAHLCDPENDDGMRVLTSDNKKALVEMADHMGPDYAQALYHAAVFITKVA